MDECPISFKLQLPSSLETPKMIMAFPPVGQVSSVYFDKWMDETVTPALASFSVIVDGVPNTMLAVAWGPDSDLLLSHSLPPATVDVIYTLDVTDPNLRDIDGGIAQAPQSVRSVV